MLLSGSRAWFRPTTVSMGLILPAASYWKGLAGLTAATTAVVFGLLCVHLRIFAKGEPVRDSLGAALFAQIYAAFALSHLVLMLHMPAGRRWVFFVLAVVFAGDTGAYYVGHRWGRHKLFPAVSPGKTIEGAAGGLLSSLAAGLLAAVVLLSSDGIGIGFAVVLAFALALVGQLGDLMESLLKRVCRVKDAGGMLPGHGGLLDRLDSLVFAFPVAHYAVLFSA
jgi:phosphatidate cytidylyltransferase